MSATVNRAIIGESPGLAAVKRAVEHVAPTDATVLLLGETGTGKELVARLIHERSPRKNGPFVPVSCVALAPSLVTSELFGHEVGAFTGATRRRIGRFEQATGGTLFLDEIGELTSELQAMVLRVLQERVIERVGGDSISIDVRFVTATNRDLAGEVKAGRFRTDLYYRLNVFPVVVPPLRERRSDIPQLVEYYLTEFSRKYHRSISIIPAATLRSLQAYDWPGNIRELQNIIERAVILSPGNELVFDPSWLGGASASETAGTWAAQERQRILDALRAAGGRIYGPGGAAQRLGLNPTTLYSKMRKHRIARGDAQPT